MIKKAPSLIANAQCMEQRDADHYWYLQQFVKWLNRYFISDAEMSKLVRGAAVGGIHIPSCDAEWQALLRETDQLVK